MSSVEKDRTPSIDKDQSSHEDFKKDVSNLSPEEAALQRQIALEKALEVDPGVSTFARGAIQVCFFLLLFFIRHIFSLVCFRCISLRSSSSKSILLSEELTN
jgi:hypothetical protein